MTASQNVPISKRLVLINSISGLVTRVLTAGVFLWVIQYLLKRIPEDELQVLPIVMSIAAILPLMQIVLTAGLARHVTEAYARNDLDGVTRIVSSQVPLLFVGGMLIMLGGTLITWNVHHILTIPPSYIDETRLMLMLIVSRAAIGLPLAPFTTGLFAKQQFVRQNVIEIIGSALRAGLMVGLVLGVRPAVEWVVVAQVASQLFILLANAALSVRELPALRFDRSSIHWPTSRTVLSFGAWQFVLELAAYIRRATDAPILNELASPTAVNDFFLGSEVESQLRDFATRAMFPLLPALTAMYALKQHARMASAFLRSGRLALWVSMLFATPLIVFSYDIFSIYLGEAYPAHVDAATVMVLLLLGFPLTYPIKIFFSIAQATGNLRPIAIRVIIAQLFNLLLTLALVGIFKFGAVGSAAATLVTFAILYPFFFWPLALRTLNISWRSFILQSLLPGLAPSFAAAAIGWVSMQFAGDSSFARVATGIPICLVAYAVTLVFVLQPSDRADLGRIRQFVRL
jgi:O-antigen/teichoic acid export membrane protein